MKYYSIYEIYFHVKLYLFLFYISTNKIVFDNQDSKDR